MSCLITMSQKELHRLELIQKIRDQRLSVVQAAERLDLSRSQVHRLLRAYDRDGPAGLVSKKRSRPSNRRHSEEFRNAVLDLIRERYLDFGPTLAYAGLPMNSRGGRTTAYTGDSGSAHKPIVMRPVARGWCAWCGLVQVPAAFAPRRHSYQRTICTNVLSLPTTRPYETHFDRPRSETSQRFFQRDASKAFASRKDSKRVLVSRELFESLAVAHRPRDFVQNTLCPPLEQPPIPLSLRNQVIPYPQCMESDDGAFTCVVAWPSHATL